MEEKRKEILDNLVEDRLLVLKSQKKRLEEQLTEHAGNERKLPEQFAEHQRHKIAETIKEIKILENEQTQQAGDSRD